MEKIRETLRNMKDIPKGICISPTVVYRRHTNFAMESIEQTFNGDDVKKDITRKSLITDSYLSELGLDKQTYTQRELNENIQLIRKHPECITEKYDTMNWTESTFYTIIDIADYIYEDYIKGGQDGLCYFSFIYNNICVYIQNDSEISNPSIQFTYVKSQIDICDLDKIKKPFKFLSSAF